jgi:hypothetical protein
MIAATDENLLTLVDRDGHVRIELSWLLTSAIEFTSRYDSGALIVVLQDSALMHGRTLLEFACLPAKAGYFRLGDFLGSDAQAMTDGVDWASWIAFMNSQTSHLLRKRDPGTPWPYGMTYDTRDRIWRLADDVLQVFETNLHQIRPGPVSEGFAEMAKWGRTHLELLEPPSPILPVSLA